MTLPAAAAGTPALWYLSRGSGAVSLILLSGAVVLGVVDQRRWRAPGWPRFALHSLHRWLSLFAVSFLFVHILSAVLDSYAPIRLLDAVLPFASSYRPLWLGLGALAFDILTAVVITSLLKRKIGQRTWHAVHWLSYAAWPVAVLHGLGAGSDVKSGWLLAIVAACVAGVWMALVVRLSATAPRARLTGFGMLAAVPLAVVVWLPHGPLGRDWARRAGTPARLLAASSNATHARRSTVAAFGIPFSAYLGGTVSETSADDGLATVDLAMRLSGGTSGSADIRLEGTPLAGGGVSVQRSRVTLGPMSDPARYGGRIVSLSGGRLVAQLIDRTGHRLRADFRIALEQSSVRGTVSAVRA